ncbi:hypothetical protein [Chryseobacterium sp.]|uniref:hypothetical protein n=1 Tax=Chryseobacterium sp. TaxID=1871047 RepID=UPI0011C77EB5|nr:hypothetical protein [Chryseobacterium sp.]TXF79184.1 hypothetical protein FUA25_01965 [Chryseobacterium sp.]
MKRQIIFLIFALIFSCSEKKEHKDSSVIASEKEMVTAIKNPEAAQKIPADWLQYYTKHAAAFSPDRFILLNETKFDLNFKGHVHAIFDQNFDPVYAPFLVFNPSKTLYLDFDSYQWILDADGNASFEADQELNLVDLKNKKVSRVAFYGPSFWIEDAYWKNDSVFVTLENSYERVLFMNEYDLKTLTKKSYQYPDTLNFSSDYAKLRLRKNGIKVE